MRWILQAVYKRGMVDIEEIEMIEYNSYVRICFQKRNYNVNRSSDERVADIVEQALALKEQAMLESVFSIFMDKMDDAEKSVQEQGYFSEEEVEAELAKI